MLPKHQRLTTQDVRSFQKVRPFCSSRYCKILKKDSPLSYSRFALVIPKSLSLKGVHRNQFRRRVYDGLNILSQTDSIPVGDYLLICHRALSSLKGESMKNALLKTLRS